MPRSPLLPIFLIVLVDVLGLTIVIPLLAIYAEHFGASAVIAALLMPTFAACQLVAGPILGRLSDRHGRRPILLVSQIGTLIGFVMMAEAHALWMVFAGRALDGLTAGNLTVAQAYIADHTPPERRARAFGMIGIAFGLGFMVGPAVSGMLSQYSLAAPFWAAATLSAMSICGTAFLLPRDAPTAPTGAASGPGGTRLSILDWGHYRAYLERPVLRGLLIQFFTYMFSFSLFTGGFALYAERHLAWHGHPFTPREIGFTFAGAGFIGAMIQGGVFGRLIARFGEAAITAAGFVSLSVGYVLLGASPLIAVLALSTVASSLGGSVIRPAITSLITRISDRSEQGVVLGLTQSLSSIAAITAPPVAGLLIEHDLGRVWAWLAAGVALVGFLLAPIGTARVDTRVGT
jgi:DHA1 family tetracycline resistance protein-like MFS transporter